MRKKANAPEDLYGPLIGCLGSTLRQWMKVIAVIAPAFFILIAVWSLAFGDEWRLAVSIGFWITLAFWLVMVGFWVAKRLRTPRSDGR